MSRRPPGFTRTATLFPSTTLFRSYWSNGSGAPLFPLHLLFVVLPLQLSFVLLPWLRFVIAGLGVWCLARELGLGQRGSLVACLIYPLSGLPVARSEEHTSELQSLMRISYAVFCLKKKKYKSQ